MVSQTKHPDRTLAAPRLRALFAKIWINRRHTHEDRVGISKDLHTSALLTAALANNFEAAVMLAFRYSGTNIASTVAVS